MRALLPILLLLGCDVSPEDAGPPLVTTGADTAEPPDVGPYECHPIHAACEPGFSCIDWAGAFECHPSTDDLAPYASCDSITDCAHGLACVPNNDVYPGFKGCFAWCEAWDEASCGGAIECTQEPILGPAAGVLDLGVCLP